MHAGPSTSRPGNRPGPKPRLSRELVIATAVDLGVETVSIGAVADALGVAPGSLYRYIDGRDDLVASALEALFTAAAPPLPEHGWRTFLETEAWTHWDLLRRYSGLVRRYEGRLFAVAIRRVEELTAGLVALGFSEAAALLAVDTVLDLVHDGADQAARISDSADAEQVTAVNDALACYRPPLRAALEEVLADPTAHMARKLTIVLDGIAAGVAPPSEL